jgi:hypothetical protein
MNEWVIKCNIQGQTKYISDIIEGYRIEFTDDINDALLYSSQKLAESDIKFLYGSFEVIGK